MGLGVITVRAFVPSDIPAAVALESALQPEPWTTGIFEDELKAEGRSYVVAEADAMVGFGGVMVVGEEAHVTNLLVAPERRRQGIGRQIFRSLVEDSIALGARHLTLEVRSDNLAALGLYQGLGLAPVGIRPGYYRDADALIMWAHDIDTPEYLENLS